jgi:hypothetical protein
MAHIPPKAKRRNKNIETNSAAKTVEMLRAASHKQTRPHGFICLPSPGTALNLLSALYS